jgi:hypothetical protein
MIDIYITLEPTNIELVYDNEDDVVSHLCAATKLLEDLAKRLSVEPRVVANNMIAIDRRIYDSYKGKN